MGEGYRAFVTPDGRYMVLAPDGLAWESEHPTLEAAQAYALALNEWLAVKPDASRVAPFFTPAWPQLEPTGDDLLRILDRLTRAEDHALEVIGEHAMREWAA